MGNAVLHISNLKIVAIMRCITMCVAYMKNVRCIHHFVLIIVSNGYSIHHDSIHFISVTTGGKSTTFICQFSSIHKSNKNTIKLTIESRLLILYSSKCL